MLPYILLFAMIAIPMFTLGFMLWRILTGGRILIVPASSRVLVQESVNALSESQRRVVKALMPRINHLCAADQIFLYRVERSTDPLPPQDAQYLNQLFVETDGVTL